MWRTQGVLLLFVFVSSWLAASRSEQCQMGMAMTCMLESLNMNTDGIATLRKIPPAVFYAIRVDMIRMPANPSGVFLQRMAEFVDKVEIYTYHEKVFQVLPKTSLTEISIYSAQSLSRLLIAPQTVTISTLYVADCALDRVPPTIGNLESLGTLTISHCLLKSFTFDMFIGNAKLIELDLSNNEIGTIAPSTIQTPYALAIENLYLSRNRLENLDMAAFYSLTALRGLDLSFNHLIKVTAQSTVSWSNINFWSLEGNQLKTLDLLWLSAPNLQRLLLSSNQLEAVPQRLRRFPSLQMVALSENHLKTIDLAPFAGLPNLNEVDFSFNPAARVMRASRPTSLPMLNTLYAEHCAQLARFNTTGLDLPAINFVSLANSNFTTVPRLGTTFPSLETYSLENNPLSCALLQANTELILSGKLILGLPRDPATCPVGHVTLKESLSLCCKA